jgi:hypothetical protein
MIFFVVVLMGIVAFVAWVMGVPIPGLSDTQYYQPNLPFQP